MEHAKMADDPYQKLEEFLTKHDGIASVSDLAEIAGVDDHIVRGYCRARGVRRIGTTFAFGRAAAVTALDEILGSDAGLPEAQPSYELELVLDGHPGDLIAMPFQPRDWPTEVIRIWFSRPVVIRSVMLERYFVALASDHPIHAGRSLDKLPLKPIEAYIPTLVRTLNDIGTHGIVAASVPTEGELPIKGAVELRPFRMFGKRAQ